MEKQKNIDVFENDKISNFEKGDMAPPLESPGPEGYPPPIEKKKKVGLKTSITITFRENRTFELHIGQEVLRFEGMESKQINKDLLEHPAFKQARKYFTIKGI